MSKHPKTCSYRCLWDILSPDLQNYIMRYVQADAIHGFLIKWRSSIIRDVRRARHEALLWLQYYVPKWLFPLSCCSRIWWRYRPISKRKWSPGYSLYFFLYAEGGELVDTYTRAEQDIDRRRRSIDALVFTDLKKIDDCSERFVAAWDRMNDEILKRRILEDNQTYMDFCRIMLKTQPSTYARTSFLQERELKATVIAREKGIDLEVMRSVCRSNPKWIEACARADDLRHLEAVPMCIEDLD